MLITNSRLRERLGQNGRQYIRQHHRWDAVIGRFNLSSCVSEDPNSH